MNAGAVDQAVDAVACRGRRVVGRVAVGASPVGRSRRRCWRRWSRSGAGWKRWISGSLAEVAERRHRRRVRPLQPGRTVGRRCCGSPRLRPKRGCPRAGTSGRGTRWSASRSPPILPAAAAAVAAGEISGQHASVITRCIEHIPLQIAHEAAPVAERMLVASRSPRTSRRRWPRPRSCCCMRLDPDGAEPRDAELERKRAFGLRNFGDGSSTPHGHLTPDVTAALETILDALSAPLPAADGLPDERTPAQRRHDALGEAALRLLRSEARTRCPPPVACRSRSWPPSPCKSSSTKPGSPPPRTATRGRCSNC